MSAPIITPEILQAISKIEYIRGQQNQTRSLINQEQYTPAAGATLRLSGINITNNELESLTSVNAFTAEHHQTAFGYKELQQHLLQYPNKLPAINETYIRQTHINILKYNQKEDRYRGKYKKIPNYLTFPRSKTINIETINPYETPRKIEELTRFINEPNSLKSLHPLIKAAHIHNSLLHISPFQSHNIPLAILITKLYLIHQGYPAHFETILEENKEEYFNTLTEVIKSKSSQEPWIVMFLSTIHHQLKSPTSTPQNATPQSKNTLLPPLSHKILEAIEEHQYLGISEISQLTNANKNTIKVRLKELVASGHLKRHGKARATWYTNA